MKGHQAFDGLLEEQIALKRPDFERMIALEEQSAMR